MGKDYNHKRYLSNKEKIIEQISEYRKTIKGRAVHLVSGYILQDRRNGFEKSVDFDGQWLVDNILTKPCVYCGETDWHKLGCNRLDNSKPHTKDNVEPCCYDCNTKKLRERRIYQYTLDGKLVKIWDKIKDVIEGGYSRSCVQAALRGMRYSSLRKKWYISNKYKGYIWSYEPL